MDSRVNSIDVGGVVDHGRISRVQIVAVVLCGLVMFLDGFDTQAISYIAPVLAQEWSIPRAELGPIFSSALVGLMIGYLFLSPLSDRIGHKKVLVASTFAFSIFTFLTLAATNVGELIALRLLTGIGLGTAAPSAIALTGEYSPKRLRASFVLAIYCGFSLGFIVAGVAAAQLIPHFGWRSLLMLGGAAPLLVGIMLIFWLPESLRFLVLRKRDHGAARTLVRRLGVQVGSDTTLELESPEQVRASLASLFRDGLGSGTVLLWLAFMINLGLFYFLQSWLPSVLTEQGYALGTVATATALTTVGGIAAALATGPSMDRLDPYYTMAAIYALGFFFLIALGFALTWPLAALLTATFLTGFCVSGGQKSLIALGAVFYPASMRSTGLGWALGIGRVGGIAGPLLGGWLLGMQLTPRLVFCLTALPMVAAALMMVALGARYRKRG